MACRSYVDAQDALLIPFAVHLQKVAEMLRCLKNEEFNSDGFRRTPKTGGIHTKLITDQWQVVLPIIEAIELPPESRASSVDGDGNLSRTSPALHPQNGPTRQRNAHEKQRQSAPVLLVPATANLFEEHTFEQHTFWKRMFIMEKVTIPGADSETASTCHHVTKVYISDTWTEMVHWRYTHTQVQFSIHCTLKSFTLMPAFTCKVTSLPVEVLQSTMPMTFGGGSSRGGIAAGGGSSRAGVDSSSSLVEPCVDLAPAPSQVTPASLPSKP